MTCPVPYGQIVNPKRDDLRRVVGNLPAGAADGATFQTGAVMYDSQGVAHKVFYNFAKVAASPDKWTLNVQDENGVDLLAAAAVAFDASGVLTAPATDASGLATVDLDTSSFAGWTSPVKLDLKGLTQFGGASQPRRTASRTATRWARCSRSSSAATERSPASSPTGCASRWASWPSPRSTTRAVWRRPAAAPSEWASTRASRTSARQVPAAAARLMSGALEMSNVDLAEEFTGLIVAQRGFQANSRVITTSDEILQDLVNLKR